MSYLVDTNVLIRLAQPSDPLNSQARSALLILRRRREDLFITPQNLIEFWAVATRPVANNGLSLTAEQAARELKKVQRIFNLLPDDANIYVEWLRLVIKHRVAGKQAHDARLVAVMRAHGVTHLLTFNAKDFARFDRITTVEPQTIK